jgi:hypothetical protein
MTDLYVIGRKQKWLGRIWVYRNQSGQHNIELHGISSRPIKRNHHYNLLNLIPQIGSDFWLIRTFPLLIRNDYVSVHRQHVQIVPTLLWNHHCWWRTMFVDFVDHLYPRIYFPTNMLLFLNYYIYINITLITLFILNIYPQNKVPTNQQNFSYP